MISANLLMETSCELGEGCVWDEKRNRLYFVDIIEKKIHCLEPETNKLSYMQVTELIGTIVLYEDGSILGMEKNKFVKIDFDKKQEKLLHQLKLQEGMRFNDGKCDFNGHLWVGTMALDQDSSKAKYRGKLYCFEVNERDENNPIKQKYCMSGYTIPNGLAISNDHRYFYHIDTKEQRIDRYDIKENGRIENRRPLIYVPEREGNPDGMTIDRDGNLWVAMWGGSKVVGYDVARGEKLEEIILPEKFVTCCTFGGEDMQTLYITTAKNGQSFGGHLYSVRLNAKGLKPERLFI